MIIRGRLVFLPYNELFPSPTRCAGPSAIPCAASDVWFANAAGAEASSQGLPTYFLGGAANRQSQQHRPENLARRMIIPITKGQQTAPGAPAQGMPSETNLLMALATMHDNGRLAALTQQDQPMLEESNRTERGVSTGREGAIREREMKRPPMDTDRIMRPGERVPDRGQGGTQMRDVRGI